jgi:hypothetical protein
MFKLILIVLLSVVLSCSVNTSRIEQIENYAKIIYDEKINDLHDNNQMQMLNWNSCNKTNFHTSKFYFRSNSYYRVFTSHSYKCNEWIPKNIISGVSYNYNDYHKTFIFMYRDIIV